MSDQLERVTKVRAAVCEFIPVTPETADRIAARVIDILRPELEDAGTCAWWEDGEMWESSCGVAYMFNSDGPEDNGHRFCHKCGKRIEIDAARQEGK